MKTRMIIVVIVSAIITLSFTFAASRNSESAPVSEGNTQSAPVGGLVSEDSK